MGALPARVSSWTTCHRMVGREPGIGKGSVNYGGVERKRDGMGRLSLVEGGIAGASGARGGEADHAGLIAEEVALAARAGGQRCALHGEGSGAGGGGYREVVARLGSRSQPVVDVPGGLQVTQGRAVGLTAEGLPVGIEIDGPENSDRRLLAIAATLEQIFGFSARPPSRE